MVAKMFDTTVPVLPRTRSFLGLAHGINHGIKRTDIVDGLGKQQASWTVQVSFFSGWMQPSWPVPARSCWWYMMFHGCRVEFSCCKETRWTRTSTWSYVGSKCHTMGPTNSLQQLSQTTQPIRNVPFSTSNPGSFTSSFLSPPPPPPPRPRRIQRLMIDQMPDPAQGSQCHAVCASLFPFETLEWDGDGPALV